MTGALLLLLLQVEPLPGQLLPDHDPRTLRLAVRIWERHAPEPWRGQAMSFVAQVGAESGFDESAESPVGALGLVQLMPFHAPRNPAELLNAKRNLILATRYMGELYRTGRSSRRVIRPEPGHDLPVAQAAFNCGPGHIYYLSSGGRRVVGGLLVARDLPMTIDNVLDTLPDVTGRHSRETITYLRRIAAYELLLEARYGGDLRGLFGGSADRAQRLDSHARVPGVIGDLVEPWGVSRLFSRADG